MEAKFLKLYCLLFLVCFSTVNIYSQENISKIYFLGTSKQISKTKKILTSYKVFLLIDNEEVEIIYNDSSYFRIPKFTQKQKEYIENKNDVVLKFKKGRRCYITLFPNGFVEPWVISGLEIYLVKTRRNFFNLFTIRWPSRDLGISYGQKKMKTHTSRHIPLIMIKCNEYNGEYEN
ncbi:MAG: hypothetical protein KAH25_07950 [Bacteroidales bacterium]|nr:hypothetical protein [Bacteroidales bacterium]